MTITPNRPARQLTRDEAKILAHYAAGESAKTITTNTDYTIDLVGRVLHEHAGNDRTRAHQLVLEYQERTQAVAAARGLNAPPAPRVQPRPAAPAAAKTPAAPENTEPQITGPQITETEPVGTLEFESLLQAADATGVPRLQRAATKIRDLITELRTDLAQHTREATLRAEQAKLEAQLAAIKEQLRPQRTQPIPPTASSTEAGPAPLDAKAVRAWAQKQGLYCPARGRIPDAVTDAYQQAVTGR
jgi:hypothetical protein